MLGLLPLLLIISNIVTKPLRKLNEAINDVSEGNFDQQVEVLTHDEVGEVAECFNRMVLAIKELIDKNYVITLQEKESELAALQAQINPHFYIIPWILCTGRRWSRIMKKLRKVSWRFRSFSVWC